jgi:cytidylate kinase
MPESHKESLPSRIEQRIDAQITLAHRLNKTAVAPSPKPAPFVTIARQFGCEAMTLAEELAQKMPAGPWPVYNRQIFETMAQETNVSERLLNALDVHARNGIEEFFENLLGPTPTDLRLLHQLVRTVRGLGLLGHCIIVGRGSSALTHGLPGGIHVRLIAPHNWRERNLIQRFGWKPDQAHAVMREEEHARHSFFQKYLGQNPNNPELYDLVLNTARLSRPEQAAVIYALYQARFPE